MIPSFSNDLKESTLRVKSLSFFFLEIEKILESNKLFIPRTQRKLAFLPPNRGKFDILK